MLHRVDSYDLTRRVGEEDMRIHLIDTAGSEEMKALRPKYMAKCDGFILVYSVEDLGSFQELADFVQQIRQVKGKSCVPMVLVGNKGDSRECAVPGPLAQQLASELHCELVITSAKWGDNVESIFAKVCMHTARAHARRLALVRLA